MRTGRTIVPPPQGHQWTVVSRRHEPEVVSRSLWTMVQKLPAGTILRPVGIR